MKVVRSDNASELKFADLYKKKGIVPYHSCSETPEQNSVVERKHQHILNVARALMFQSQVPLEFWGDCVLIAVFIINRLRSPLLKDKSPFEMLTSKEMDYKRLCVFGFLAYCSTSPKNRKKFQPGAQPCIFFGYPAGFKGYKVMNIETNKILISRNVTFHEDIFLYAQGQSPSYTDFFISLQEPDVVRGASASTSRIHVLDPDSSTVMNTPLAYTSSTPDTGVHETKRI